jgi:hypothetical protein
MMRWVSESENAQTPKQYMDRHLQAFVRIRHFIFVRINNHPSKEDVDGRI